jgi:Na+-translocating ferredoxin:NAD+ oxidoreductase RnfG subunit
VENIAKTLIIITLIYYLIKGLIYLVLWQTTYKIEEKAKARKAKNKQKKKILEELYTREDESDSDS